MTTTTLTTLWGFLTDLLLTLVEVLTAPVPYRTFEHGRMVRLFGVPVNFR